MDNIFEQIDGCEILKHEPATKHYNQLVLISGFMYIVGLLLMVCTNNMSVMIFGACVAMLNCMLLSSKSVHPDEYTVRFSGNMSANDLLRIHDNFELKRLSADVWVATKR